MPPLVQVRHLSKRYGEDLVLRDVSMEIEAGEFVAITGPSGSGKSTLLNVIGGLDDDYQGQVAIDGQDLAALDDRQRSRLRAQVIGFVFQSFHLLDHLTCRENVLLPSYFREQSDDAAALKDADERLARVGLLDKADVPPARLSGGQKQRIAIARALANRPRLLLCDEPTGNLDARTGAQILDLFRALHDQEGISFVVVTHEERVSRMAGRVIRLEDGRVSGDAASAAEAAPAPVPAPEEPQRAGA